jgi:mannose-6-phosphate isomerase-like protein (cupin superfamily)
VTYAEERPWGRFEILYEEERLKVKRITVKPGLRLSLQSHNQRSENWVIIQGRAIVTLENGRAHLSPHQAIFIPRGAKHRVENPGQEDLVFIEVQTGNYLGEGDITRFQDDFQRV